MLILPIKKKWFDMVERREKKEEYRDDTPYWRSRFLKLMGAGMLGKHHKALLRNGYGADKPTLEIEFTLEFREGREQWGAEPGKKYFVLVILDVRRMNSLRRVKSKADTLRFAENSKTSANMPDFPFPQKASPLSGVPEGRKTFGERSNQATTSAERKASR